MRLRLKHKSNEAELIFTINGVNIIKKGIDKEDFIMAQTNWDQDVLDKLKGLDYEYRYLCPNNKVIKEDDKESYKKYIEFFVPINRLINILN